MKTEGRWRDGFIEGIQILLLLFTVVAVIVFGGSFMLWALSRFMGLFIELARSLPIPRDVANIVGLIFSFLGVWFVIYTIYWVLIKPRIGGIVAVGEELR